MTTAYEAACKEAREIISAVQAYCNVRSALNSIDFSDAFAVAEDSARETEGA